MRTKTSIIREVEKLLPMLDRHELLSIKNDIYIILDNLNMTQHRTRLGWAKELKRDGK